MRNRWIVSTVVLLGLATAMPWPTLAAPGQTGLLPAMATSSAKAYNYFIAGYSGTILNSTGSGWSLQPIPTTQRLYRIWGSAGDDVYCVGDEGIFHYDGVAWTNVNSSTTFGALWGSGPDDVFAGGSSGAIRHWNGSTWAVQTSGTAQYLTDIWGSGPDDVYAVGFGGTVLHYNGSAWSVVRTDAGVDYNGVWGTGANNVYVVGTGGTILRYNGTSWSTQSSGTTNGLEDVWGLSANEIYVVGRAGTIRRGNGSSWVGMTVASGTTDLFGIYGRSSTDIVACGNSGTVLHYSGSGSPQWTQQTSGTTNWLYGVWSGPGDAEDSFFWDGFAPPPDGEGLNGFGLAVLPYQDMLVVAGDFSQAGDVTANGIAAWDGTGWSSLGTGFNDMVFDLIVYQGQLIAGGGFTTAGGVAANGIAAWNGSSWEPLGAPGITGGTDQVITLTTWNGKLIAGGDFTSAGGTAVSLVAQWDGSSWSALPGTGLSGTRVIDLTVYQGELYAAGLFGTPTLNIAVHDGGSWASLTGGAGADDACYKLQIYDGQLVVGGLFQHIDDMEFMHMASWDGSSWMPLGEGLGDATPYTGVFGLGLYDGSLVASGPFVSPGPPPLTGLARWDGGSWSNLGSGLTGSAWSFATFQDQLYMVGLFAEAGSSISLGIARWDEVPQPPVVTFTAPASVPPGQALSFQADIQDNYSVQAALLHFRQGGTEDFTTFVMDPVTGKDGGYTATVPGASVTLFGVEYFISASDGSQTTFVPASAPTVPGYQAVTVAGQALAAGDAETYQLFGFPFVTSGGLATVFEDDLGRYDRSKWRLGRWNPASHSYAEYPSVAALSPGRGYWLIQRDPRAVDAGGLTTNSVAGVTLTLEPGWNMIAGPYFFDVAWMNVLASTDIESPIGRSGTTYVPSNVLEPWQGYWVYNNGSTQAITIPGTAVLPKNPAGPAALALTGEGEWSLQVDATCGRRAERGLELGVSPAAQDGLDGLDRHDPPALPGDVDLSLLLVVDGASHHLRRDVRGPLGAGRTWELVVQAAAGDGPVSLEFGGLAQVPSELEVRLLGIAGEYDLRAASQVSLDAGDGGEQHLLLAVGEQDYVEGARQEVDRLPRPFALQQNYPNPFNPQTKLGFSLAERSWVQLVVYDVRGRQVRRLLDEVRGPGQHWVSWDGRDDGGAAVAAGVYFAAIQAGEQAATRKMVLVK